MEFFRTYVAPQAGPAVADVIASGWLSEGRMVRRFEEQLQGDLRIHEPVAVNSGTAALHLALAVAGVGQGDEVIVPPQTFVASALVVLMQGARPVFADIDPTTGNLSPAAFERAIGERTRAVMPVHWGGYPCEMDEIGAIAARHGVVVVEDAAHALGATYRGHPVGALSHFTAFSFQAIKHLTTGDGGAVCCADPEDAREARARRWFGIDRANSPASLLGERQYSLTSVGFKYHMNDVSAALGLANMAGLGARLERRREIGTTYRRALADVPGLTLLASEDDRTHAYWLFTLLVERRDDFIRKLASYGIPTSVVHQRIDRHPVFGGERPELQGQAYFDAHQIAIPVHDGLSDADVRCVIDTIRSGW